MLFHRKLCLFTILMVLCLLLSGCASAEKDKREDNYRQAENADEPELSEEQPTIEPNQTVSLFCWHPYFMNDAAFFRLVEPLRSLGVNRVYQQLSTGVLNTPEFVLMVENFSRAGIETISLTGDPDWLADGLGSFQKQIDALDEYNKGSGEKNPITAIAIDAECYSRDEWKKDPKSAFAAFIQMMEEAKGLANSRGIRVIQVIPTSFDEIDPELFREFVARCCDEVSLMNYVKEKALSAIAFEVQVCVEQGIPVETILETMPISKKHGVSERITYYYDGPEAMAAAAEEMRAVYGTELGIGYHHYESIHSMLTGTSLVSFYPRSNSEDPDRNEMKQPQNPCVLWLYGSDGSRTPAYPYWPKGHGDEMKYCYLAPNVAPGVEYQLVFSNTEYSCEKNYQLEDEDSVSESVTIRITRDP